MAGRDGAQPDAGGVFQLLLYVSRRYWFRSAAAYHLAAYVASGDVGAGAMEERALHSTERGGIDSVGQEAQRKSMERGWGERLPGTGGEGGSLPHRSEERCVGEGCRSR